MVSFMTEKSSSLSLLTDLYEITMAYSYWKEGMQDVEAVFHAFFRRLPFQGGYVIAAGLEPLIHYLKSFSFSNTDIDYLATLQGHGGSALFDKEFLKWLSQMKFSCDIDAVPEGSVVFPYEPLVRVQGPLIQCQLLESALLNAINFPSLIATKASRICRAADGDSVLEFGLRRSQGFDGAMTATRSAYIGGCHATSNTLAGKLFGIPVRGTIAHSWVMSFDEEIDALRSYARAMPNNCILLVDTYDSIKGIQKAIEVGKELEKQGGTFLGVRLDSGDLAYLSIQARQMLDTAGMSHVQIFASNELDEYIIHDLKQQGAKITVWGVGTNLVTAKDHPALDGVYKLSAIRYPGKKWQYKLKLSEQMTKVSNPGILQVRRFYEKGESRADILYDIHHIPQKKWCLLDPFDPTRKKIQVQDTDCRDLLVPLFRKGYCVYEIPPLPETRRYASEELRTFCSGIKRFYHPHEYVVGMEEGLYQTKIDLIRKVRGGV